MHRYRAKEVSRDETTFKSNVDGLRAALGDGKATGKAEGVKVEVAPVCAGLYAGKPVKAGNESAEKLFDY